MYIEELRVGNILSLRLKGKNGWQPRAITAQNIVALEGLAPKMAEFAKPLVLNDKYIRAVGFKKEKHDLFYEMGEFRLSAHPPYVLYWKQQALVHDIRYMHKLQNVILDLTGRVVYFIDKKALR